MNKFSILVASVAAVFAFSSCETSHDDNPVLNEHKGTIEAKFLNEPVMQNQYIDLTEENATGALALTCSQPTEYGYAASVRYIPQISLTKDFADYREYSADWSSVCSDIKITNRNMAEAICEMLGVNDASELPKDYFPVYVRLNANVYNNEGQIVPGTNIVSNVVSFNHVRIAYMAVWVPDVLVDLYLIGTMTDWGANEDYRFVQGPEKNTWVTGHVDMPAGTNFKVSPKSWNAEFNGAQFNCGRSSDEPIPFNTDYELYNDSGSSDIPLGEDFSGVAKVSYVEGTYYLKLITD